jgi:hypothetical protein
VSLSTTSLSRGEPRCEAPGSAGLAEYFSTRFTRTVTLAAGRYRFKATTDDGNRLWVDDPLQINAWGADGLTTHSVDLDLAAGDHTLRFQYVEHTGGATAPFGALRAW